MKLQRAPAPYELSRGYTHIVTAAAVVAVIAVIAIATAGAAGAGAGAGEVKR